MKTLYLMLGVVLILGACGKTDPNPEPPIEPGPTHTTFSRSGKGIKVKTTVKNEKLADAKAVVDLTIKTLEK
mgnify:CR=1 FL=1